MRNWLMALGVVLALLVSSCGNGESDQLKGTATPEPTATVEGEEDYFRGTLNGFEFGGSLPVTEMSSKCIGNPVKDGGATEANSSGLDFELIYLPAAAQLNYVASSLCLDDVFLINKQYSVGGTGFFQVGRRKGPPVFEAAFTSDQLRPATIRGRPAVVAEGVIYLRDGVSSWYLYAMGLDIKELERVAEGLQAQ